MEEKEFSKKIKSGLEEERMKSLESSTMFHIGRNVGRQQRIINIQ